MSAYSQPMINKQSVMITVAPNGARKTKEDHPLLPLTPEELAQAAKDCLDAGAAMMHLHARDAQGRHSLSPEHFLEAIACIKKTVGDSLVLQVTSEACGMYSVDEQMAAMRQLEPEALSMAINEFVPDEVSEPEAARFFQWVSEKRIFPQFIVYSPSELKRYRTLVNREIIPATPHLLLLVLGKYAQGQQSTTGDLRPFLPSSGIDVPWTVCAFGKEEFDCMKLAVSKGGHARVGFENNIYMSDGTRARDNAALVHQLATSVLEDGYELATADDIRNIIGN